MAQRKISVVLHFPSIKSTIFTDRGPKILTVSIKSALFMDRSGTKQAERALGLSLRSLLWGAGWRICQLRCPALCKDLGKSEDKERYIPDASELRSESFHFCIERLGRRICRSVTKVVQYPLVVVLERLQNSIEALQFHFIHPVIPSCQFGIHRNPQLTPICNVGHVKHLTDSWLLHIWQATYRQQL